jgi:hypothetical protein
MNTLRTFMTILSFSSHPCRYAFRQGAEGRREEDGRCAHVHSSEIINHAKRNLDDLNLSERNGCRLAVPREMRGMGKFSSILHSGWRRNGIQPDDAWNMRPDPCSSLIQFRSRVPLQTGAPGRTACFLPAPGCSDQDAHSMHVRLLRLSRCGISRSTLSSMRRLEIASKKIVCYV